jgi:hypothetical protein
VRTSPVWADRTEKRRDLEVQKMLYISHRFTAEKEEYSMNICAVVTEGSVNVGRVPHKELFCREIERLQAIQWGEEHCSKVESTPRKMNNQLIENL